MDVVLYYDKKYLKKEIEDMFIDYKKHEIICVPCYDGVCGVRADIALVPEEYKDSKFEKAVILPMMRSPFICYYKI